MLIFGWSTGERHFFNCIYQIRTTSISIWKLFELCLAPEAFRLDQRGYVIVSRCTITEVDVVDGFEYKITASKVLCFVIVVATNSEPIAGWIDNLYGATGVVVGCGTGVLRTLQCDERVCAQIVPVDMVCNAIIAAAHSTASRWVTVQ